jgi:predicted  nucleic acid-binding Zn-ribbon protein
MSASSTLEERLEQVEHEVAQLKSQVQNLRPQGNWLAAMTGLFKDDREFDEVLRLGKELRDADRPSPE